MFSWELYNQAPIVGILRNFSHEIVKKILTLYLEAGLTTIEITMNTPGAVDMIKEANKEFGGKLNIGAGTVCTEQELILALGAGASFIVTPITNEVVIKKAVRAKVPIFPGAFTPTEIYKAWSLGASMVKVFPATFFGTDYIKEIKAPLGQIKLIPTGGVNVENLLTFFQKGADGVGMGGQLFAQNLIDHQKWDDLLKLFKQILSKYQEFNSKTK